MTTKTDFSKYLRKPSSENKFEQYRREEKPKSALKEVAQQVPLGAAKGAMSSYGNILELVGANPQEPFTPSQQERIEREARGTPEQLAFSIGDELAPETSGRLPTSRDIGEFSQMLGAPEAQTSAGRIAGIGAEAIGSAAMLGPQGIGLAGAGAAGGEAVRELGGPEWLAQAADIGINFSNLGKAALSKNLKPSSKQEKVAEFLRSKGIPDKNITPIIQDKKKLGLLSKVASKYERNDPWLNAIKGDLGTIFEDIRGKGKEAGFLEGKPLMAFEESFDKAMEKVPRMYRGLIKKEISDLFHNPIDFTELHDFNKAVNAIVKDVQGGKAAIGLLKDPIEKAMASMNPDLYKELKLTNEAYSKLSKFTDKMTKKNWESLLNMGQIGGLVYGLLTLNTDALETAGLTLAGRYGVKKLLTSPRLQNMHGKLWSSFLKNDVSKTLRITSDIKKELQKEQSASSGSYE